MLEQLLNEGDIGALDVIDISLQPELAEESGIKSVPWLELGPLTFIGEQSLPELREWVIRLTEPEAMVDYYQKLLAGGELSVAEQMLQRNPATLSSLLSLIVRAELPMQVRVGTVALFEGVAGEAPLQQLIPELSALLAHEDYRIRADVVYLLGLSEAKQAMPFLTEALEDDNSEVREIAADAIDEVSNNDM